MLMRWLPRHLTSLRLYVFAAFLLLSPFCVAASEEIDYLPMSVGLFGGLAIFLYGMDKMSVALKRAAGDRMKTLLARLTRNRISGMLTGAGITAVIQSSSVTTVLLVGFISAGLMSLNQAVCVIMGANIGTTITTQIIAFKITKAALAMVAIGFLIQFNSKKENTRHYGNMLFGLGLIFLGMNLMSDAMSPLRDYQPFIDTMERMDNVFFAILLGFLFTALIQSSSATTGIVIVLAGQGFITLETGIALAMGANIGTCVTASLAAIGKTREAMQTAAVHVSFNLLGVLIWLPLIGVLAEISISISPSHTELMGVERMAMELPRQIANANTLFNVLNTIIMLPFAEYFVKFVRRVIPYLPKSPAQKKDNRIQSKYLSKAFLHTPDIALDQAQLEIGRIGRRVCNMMHLLPPPTPERNTEEDSEVINERLKQIELLEDEVEQLYANILAYLGRLRLEPLSDQQSRRQIRLISITDQLESVADLVVDTMLPLAYQALNANITISPTMCNILDTFQERVDQSMLDCVNAIRRGDDSLAQQVLSAKRELNSLLDAVLAHQAERLVEDDPNRIKIFRYEMEWVDSLKRIYTLSKRIAKVHLRKRTIAPETQS